MSMATGGRSFTGPRRPSGGGARRARGGVGLPATDQEIDGDGNRGTLVHRAEAPVEGWNAQISLLTGMAAADLMLSARVGLLRTLPEADPRDLARLHRTAAALGLEWPGATPGGGCGGGAAG